MVVYLRYGLHDQINLASRSLLDTLHKVTITQFKNQFMEKESKY